MYHCDKHIVKMILESAQMLCTALWLSGATAPYKQVHMKHPCTLWALESLSNWKWLRELTKELNEEFKFRYNKEINHKSYEVVKTLSEPNIVDKGLTKFAQAMPEQFKDPEDAIKAYRQYYVGAKHNFAVWTKRPIPPWYPLMREEYEAKYGVGHVTEKYKPKSKLKNPKKGNDKEEDGEKKKTTIKTNRKKIIKRTSPVESAEIKQEKKIIKEIIRPSTASSVRSTDAESQPESLMTNLSKVEIKLIKTRRSRRLQIDGDALDDSANKRKASDDDKPAKRRKQ